MTMPTRTRSKVTVQLTSRSKKKEPTVDTEHVEGSDQTAEKENKKIDRSTTKTTNGTKSAAKKPSSRRPAKKSEKKNGYCLCKGVDDGTPMVLCGVCKNWYHFRCVDLTEREAEDINIYVCPTCTEKTGRQTVKDWEGPAAVEVASDGERGPSMPQEYSSSELTLTESEEDPSSDEEYVGRAERRKRKGSLNAGNAKRRTRRLSISSASFADSDDDAKTRRPSGRTEKSKLRRDSIVTLKTRSTPVNSVSPGPRHDAKRTPQDSISPPPAKRRKSSDGDIGAVGSSSSEDPTRKYCLGKLQEVFLQIFFKYPYARIGLDGSNVPALAEPKTDLVEEDKSKVEDTVGKFAAEVEQCVWEIYAEPDKNGKLHAGGKYKDRFRMLQFNLSKPDRVLLHKRIASEEITPKELSTMSSTDLANEELKQSIKIAEKEALEHSILQKTSAPRAKITHKGLQELEDIDGNGELSRLREREKEREQEEEEKRERERLARLKAAQEHQQMRASSASAQHQSSAPPESPVVPQTPAWGAPPPVPGHASQSNSGQFDSGKPLFIHTQSDFLPPPEPEMNLADLINIDEELSAQDITHSAAVASSSFETALPDAPSPSPIASAPAPTTPIGISPFAVSQPDIPNKPFFDLNSVWAVPRESLKETRPESTAAPPEMEPKDGFMDVEMTDEGAEDQDFDMFLEKEDPVDSSELEVAQESPQNVFDKLPTVWTGKIMMPLDSAIPQETEIVARQMGGRTLTHDSVLWKTLFPSFELRIDGRVPVENSSKFLLQTRLNPTKELIAVAFSPANELNNNAFNLLADYLIAKHRHGLVFPWGNRPKEHCPGRELYIIPLLPEEPLPDFIELLDDLCLHKARTSRYLIGIWVLNKGKLVPPPVSTLSLQGIAPLTHTPTQLASMPMTISSHIPTVPPAGISSNLAAEVASLTPEQIREIMQRLTVAVPQIPAVTPYPAVFAPPTSVPPAMPALPPQAWPQLGMAFGTSQSPPNPSVPLSSPPRHDSYPHPYQREMRADPEYGRDDRSERGWRGGSRGRGRGRGGNRAHGRGRDHDYPPLRDTDSGWSRRGRGGPPASARGPREDSRWN